MGLRRARGAEGRKVLLAGHDLARLLDPVLAERSLHPVDDRPLHTQAGIAPVVLVLPAPRPLLGESIAADVADAAVDDRFLAMIAVVEPAEVGERRRMESDQANAGIEHQ